MNSLSFSFMGETLEALASGALWWRSEGLLCVSDLHLGKSDRIARRSGQMLPPYEVLETLDRLAADLDATGARSVVCLGDSFDDMAAARDMDDDDLDLLRPLMAGRDWTWIEGNHDPGPLGLGGSHRADLRRGQIVFRHIATPPDGDRGHEGDRTGEVSGHYHPKIRINAPGRSLGRRCFLVDAARVILPAYGAYTGGLSCDHPDLARLMGTGAQALVLPGKGARPLACPMPQPHQARGSVPVPRSRADDTAVEVSTDVS